MKILVIAPHPDDETLGCGGTLLKHKSKGDDVHWLIVTTIAEELGYTKEKIEEQSLQIQKVREAYEFSSIYQCNFLTTTLDTVPVSKIVQKISSILLEINPNIVYLPYRRDVHTDHRIIFDAASSSLKWFRCPSIKRVLAYETLSETDMALNPDGNPFHPNVFVDISGFLEKKIEIMKIYHVELGSFPFPRSEEAIRGLAALRGAASGLKAAEAFMLLREVIE